MEKFKFITIQRRRKCGAEIGTAMLIGGGLSAASGLASGLFGSSSARSNNAATLAFNREMQQKSMDFEREMYAKQLSDQENLYNKYQSPQAIAAQLAKAGLNPSALAGKGLSGSSMPSVPSVGTPATPSIGGLENPAQYLISGIDAATKGISNLSSAVLQDKNAQAVSAKLGHEIELMIAQKNGQDLLNEYQSVNNFIQQEFGHDKAGAELQEIHSRIFANYCMGHYQDAEADCKKALTMLYSQDYDIKEQQRGTLMQKLYSEWQLVQEKIKTEKSAQSVNYQSVVESKSRTAGLEFENAIKKIDSETAANTAIERLDALVAQLKKDKSVSTKQALEAEKEAEKLRVRIKHYKEYDNAAAFDEFFDNLPIIGGIVRGLAK